MSKSFLKISEAYTKLGLSGGVLIGYENQN